MQAGQVWNPKDQKNQIRAYGVARDGRLGTCLAQSEKCKNLQGICPRS